MIDVISHYINITISIVTCVNIYNTRADFPFFLLVLTDSVARQESRVKLP